MKTILFTLFTLFLLNFNAKARVITAIGGNWNAPGTWDLGAVPECGDTIVIPAGVSVHIPANVNFNDPSDPLCSQTYMQIQGIITFSSGKKIRLVAGACMNIELGGEIHPSNNGGGSSELIEIDHVDWWKAADGVLVGDADGVQLGCGIVLPVELAEYSLEIVDDKVNLSYTTASERDLDYFVIESSRDGSFYQELEIIDAVGNSSSSTNYHVVDANPFNGVSYYRLKYVNLDGSTSVLEIIPCEFYTVKYLLYPVPVNKFMFLEGEGLNDATVTLFNSLGEEIEIEKSLSSGKYQFNFEPIKSGVYFISIETGKTKKTERVVVVHK